MDTQATIEKMKQLRLSGMSDFYYRSIKEKNFPDYTRDEFIAQMIDTEWENRYNRKIYNTLRFAGFKMQASVFDVDYRVRRDLDKNIFERLLSLQFLKQCENIIITGPTGVGKSYLAHAIGHAACQQTIKTIYFTWSDLIEKINLARLDGTYTSLLRKIQKAELIILDDFGLHPFDNQARQALMDIVENRYERASLIVASQLPVSSWHQAIGEGTIADAILDRLVYSSHRIELNGESLRKNKVLMG